MSRRANLVRFRTENINKYSANDVDDDEEIKMTGNDDDDNDDDG